MKWRNVPKLILACAGMLWVSQSPAFADQACHDEVTTLQTSLNAAGDSLTPDSTAQAGGMLQILAADCAAGSTLEDVAILSSSVRELLSLEGSQ